MLGLVGLKNSSSWFCKFDKSECQQHNFLGTRSESVVPMKSFKYLNNYTLIYLWGMEIATEENQGT